MDMLIGGQWVGASDEAELEVLNPASGEDVGNRAGGHRR